MLTFAQGHTLTVANIFLNLNLHKIQLQKYNQLSGGKIH